MAYKLTEVYSGTHDADALAADIAKGKKAYVDGELVVGTLEDYDNTHMATEVYDYEEYDYSVNRNPYAYLKTNTKRCIINDKFYTKIPLNDFGNAMPYHVSKGNFFTSVHGYRVEGEIPLYDYSYLPSSHVGDTDDKTGYSFLAPIQPLFAEDELYFSVPKSNFGDATKNVVLDGFSFTSKNGFKQQGTLQNLGNVIVRLDPVDENKMSYKDTLAGYVEEIDLQIDDSALTERLSKI